MLFRVDMKQIGWILMLQKNLNVQFAWRPKSQEPLVFVRSIYTLVVIVSQFQDWPYHSCQFLSQTIVEQHIATILWDFSLALQWPENQRIKTVGQIFGISIIPMNPWVNLGNRPLPTWNWQQSHSFHACLQVCSNPLMHSCCQIFCELCWKECQKSDARCPICRDMEEPAVPAYRCRKEIEKLELRCPRGCGATFPLLQKDMLLQHLECSFQQADGCNAELQETQEVRQECELCQSSSEDHIATLWQEVHRFWQQVSKEWKKRWRFWKTPSRTNKKFLGFSRFCFCLGVTQ